jgi:hypothetical protein
MSCKDSDLLPCPFCHGRAYFYTDVRGRDQDDEFVGIGCRTDDCPVLMTESLWSAKELRHRNEDEIKQSLLKHWNKRITVS